MLKMLGTKTSELVEDATKDVSKSDGWLRLWLILSAIAALIIMLVDTALLQRKLQIFTGGFLSLDHFKTPYEAGLFITASLIADLGVTAPLAGVALWSASRLGQNTRSSSIAIVVVIVAPIMMWDFVRYRIQDYLGGAFDFSLTLELADQNIAEILAVVYSHLAAPLGILLGGGAFLIVGIWLGRSLLGGRKRLPTPPRLRSVVLRSALIFMVALGVTCLAWVSSEAQETALARKFSGKMFSSIGEALTDIDRDGYGILRRPLDTEPMNPKIFPYAMEIPGNGIDENGVAGDLPEDVSQSSANSQPADQWVHKPNVILVLLESFRADLVQAEHQGKEITPVLNQLAKDGQSVSLAFSHNGYTAPSRYHLFSGRLHGLRDGTSLIDDFRENGYEVAYFSAQDVVFGGKLYDIGYSRVDVAYDAQMEPERRFTVFDTPGSIGLPFQVIVERVTEYLDGRESTRPLFLYVNLQDTHFPYYHSGIRNIVSAAALSRSEIGPKRIADLWSTYVNTAANVDMALGKIVDAAKRALSDPTPGVIITSDHGESLYDDGYLGHGIVINDVQTAVPMIYVNLPLHMETPFGLVQLRETLRSALSGRPMEGDEINRENSDVQATKSVFQYLGNLKRPRQIAQRFRDRRIVYDFRTKRFQTSDGVWHKTDDLSNQALQEFHSLVHEWERLVVMSYQAKRRSG